MITMEAFSGLVVASKTSTGQRNQRMVKQRMVRPCETRTTCDGGTNQAVRPTVVGLAGRRPRLAHVRIAAKSVGEDIAGECLEKCGHAVEDVGAALAVWESEKESAKARSVPLGGLDALGHLEVAKILLPEAGLHPKLAHLLRSQREEHRSKRLARSVVWGHVEDARLVANEVAQLPACLPRLRVATMREAHAPVGYCGVGTVIRIADGLAMADEDDALGQLRVDDAA